MKYRLLVGRPAKADVRLAAHRYELQRPGLGRQFVAEVDAALNRVTENPLQYQVLYRGARRAIVASIPVRRLLPRRGQDTARRQRLARGIDARP